MAKQISAQTKEPPQTLQRVWALIALMIELLGDPTRKAEIERLYEECEQLLARLTFELAARIAGRPDLLSTHEAYPVTTRSGWFIRVRPKLCALHPYHQAILRRRRAAQIARYRRALGRRSSFTSKLSHLHFRSQKRALARRLASHCACAAAPGYRAAHVSPPP